MKTVKEAIENHVPCESCGNTDVSRFSLRGTVRNKQKSLMIVCDECNEVYNVDGKK